MAFKWAPSRNKREVPAPIPRGGKSLFSNRSNLRSLFMPEFEKSGVLERGQSVAKVGGCAGIL